MKKTLIAIFFMILGSYLTLFAIGLWNQFNHPNWAFLFFGIFFVPIYYVIYILSEYENL